MWDIPDLLLIIPLIYRGRIKELANFDPQAQNGCVYVYI